MTEQQKRLLEYLCAETNTLGTLYKPDRDAIRSLAAERAELLAACEEVKRWIEEDTFVDLDDLSDDAKEILAMVRAVVAKATGGTS